MADDQDAPRKRLRLDEPLKDISSIPTSENLLIDAQEDKELKFGITAYVSQETPGFSGVFKQR